MADIVQNLRGFARLDHADVDQADVHQAIRTALEMIRGRIDRRGIYIEENFGDIPRVAGSPAQLNQVFLNLLVNALQAIETTHRPDGRITITTATDDGEVVVEVADNGCGIPDDVLPQIFDPFFTTKGVGDGTGLGLSITHGMVHDQGGRLEVESDPGQGTRFRVFLAVNRRRAERRSGKPFATPHGSRVFHPPPGGGTKVSRSERNGPNARRNQYASLEISSPPERVERAW